MKGFFAYIEFGYTETSCYQLRYLMEKKKEEEKNAHVSHVEIPFIWL